MSAKQPQTQTGSLLTLHFLNALSSQEFVSNFKVVTEEQVIQGFQDFHGNQLEFHLSLNVKKFTLKITLYSDVYFQMPEVSWETFEEVIGACCDNYGIEKDYISFTFRDEDLVLITQGARTLLTKLWMWQQAAMFVVSKQNESHEAFKRLLTEKN